MREVKITFNVYDINELDDKIKEVAFKNARNLLIKKYNYSYENSRANNHIVYELIDGMSRWDIDHTPYSTIEHMIQTRDAIVEEFIKKYNIEFMSDGDIYKW